MGTLPTPAQSTIQCPEISIQPITLSSRQHGIGPLKMVTYHKQPRPGKSETQSRPQLGRGESRKKEASRKNGSGRQSGLKTRAHLQLNNQLPHRINTTPNQTRLSRTGRLPDWPNTKQSTALPPPPGPQRKTKQRPEQEVNEYATAEWQIGHPNQD